MIRGQEVGITSCSIICVRGGVTCNIHDLRVNIGVCTRDCWGSTCVTGMIFPNASCGHVDNGVFIRTGFVTITGSVTVV